MARKLLIASAILGVPVGIFCVVVHLRPAEFSVRRSATMAAPPEVVFAQVNDFRAWEPWSSWREMDRNTKVAISDPSSGKGATLSWSGNSRVGAGHMTIRESRPPNMIDLEQSFVRPLQGTARMVFTFTPEGSGTRITWRMDGTNDFFGKAVCLFMDLDATVGKSFEESLARMKSAAEKAGEAQASPAPPAGAR